MNKFNVLHLSYDYSDFINSSDIECISDNIHVLYE